ncbi:hypothetical protein EVAR_4257_1 [Eumeta japonica]|uniref:Uncharacterized protein n=1 Tax=Eumeta variegata TaxID=151549 RepID=A0A4C1Z9E9_EUMVA|nr:hypothetical protein EVAR_4257_1 [Eumeta japonica]
MSRAPPPRANYTRTIDLSTRLSGQYNLSGTGPPPLAPRLPSEALSPDGSSGCCDECRTTRRKSCTKRYESSTKFWLM